MTNRNIKKVAVLGSGVMGSRIACHFANVDADVLLRDFHSGIVTINDILRNEQLF